MQSNGILLNTKSATIFKKLNIQVGISLDGTAKSNNTNRVYHNGRGSYNETIKGFKELKKTNLGGMANCLCVIDINEKPKEVYEHFKMLGANSVHFLFQDFNYIKSTQQTIPKVGKWLVDMFDIWTNDMDQVKPEIKPLSDLVSIIFGFSEGSEIFGKSENKTLVIETDGSIETVDTLKICGNGFTNTKLNVLKNDLNDIYEESSLARLYYNSHYDLCETCQKCPIKFVCGGGYLGHRYSIDKEFDNPSIYCREIIEIVCYIQNKILREMPPEISKEWGIDYLNYDEIINSKYLE
ncbi:hypothetical protein ACQ9BO_04165 [Flavobacterium sp. P21]|uniref:hypothetical protein n=1 Tax=Flavobacterium sp. P21 TaxID=3423948 RepID=UPI003D677828